MKKFNEPKLEIAEFEAEDILTTSGEENTPSRDEDEIGGMPLNDIIAQLAKN